MTSSTVRVKNVSPAIVKALLPGLGFKNEIMSDPYDKGTSAFLFRNISGDEAQFSTKAPSNRKSIMPCKHGYRALYHIVKTLGGEFVPFTSDGHIDQIEEAKTIVAMDCFCTRHQLERHSKASGVDLIGKDTVFKNEDQDDIPVIPTEKPKILEEVSGVADTMGNLIPVYGYRSYRFGPYPAMLTGSHGGAWPREPLDAVCENNHLTTGRNAMGQHHSALEILLGNIDPDDMGSPMGDINIKDLLQELYGDSVTSTDELTPEQWVEVHLTTGGCQCGIYAYYNPPGKVYRPDLPIVAQVIAYGVVQPGSAGFIASRVKIHRIWIILSELRAAFAGQGAANLAFRSKAHTEGIGDVDRAYADMLADFYNARVEILEDMAAWNKVAQDLAKNNGLVPEIRRFDLVNRL